MSTWVEWPLWYLLSDHAVPFRWPVPLCVDILSEEFPLPVVVDYVTTVIVGSSVTVEDNSDNLLQSRFYDYCRVLGRRSSQPTRGQIVVGSSDSGSYLSIHTQTKDWPTIVAVPSVPSERFPIQGYHSCLS
jgi:hypothetical protein